jgi:hypothetical protein
MEYLLHRRPVLTASLVATDQYAGARRPEPQGLVLGPNGPSRMAGRFVTRKTAPNAAKDVICQALAGAEYTVTNQFAGWPPVAWV